MEKLISINASPFSSETLGIKCQDEFQTPTTSQPELQSEEEFIKASLKYVRKKKIDHYFLFFDEILGQGSFAKVYKGINTLTNEIVAIKVMEMKHIMQRKLYSLLEAEIQIFKSLKHPNVLRCYDILITDNHCYIVTQLCEDGQLKNYMKKQSLIKSSSETVFPFQSLIYDIYQGLLYLQRKNIVHRDIKMANILVKNGKAKISDFGFASCSRSTFTDAKVGTPINMAPESILKNIYGSKTDVWAFGLLLFEFFHGYSLFQFCKNSQQLEKEIQIPFCKQRIIAPLPEQAQKLMLMCLTYDYQMRPNFKDLWTNKYIKDLRFQNYIQSKQLIFYKQNSESKLRLEQMKHQQRTQKTEETPAQIQNEKITNQIQDQIAQQGFSFQDFLRMNAQIELESQMKKNTQINQATVSTTNSQMEQFYKKALQMMQQQKQGPNTEKYNSVQNNSIADKKQCQKTSQSIQVDVGQQDQNLISNNQTNAIELLNQTPIQDEHEKAINIKDDTNIQIQNGSEQKSFESITTPRKTESEKQLGTQTQPQAIYRKETKTNLELLNFNQNSSLEGKIQKRQKKINLNKKYCAEQETEPKVLQKTDEFGSSVSKALNVKENLKNESEKLKNLKKFDKFINSSKRDLKQSAKNQKSSQIDTLLCCLECLRLITKYLKYLSKLFDQFQTKNVLNQARVQSHQGENGRSLFELEQLIFVSGALRKQVLLEEEMFQFCNNILMKKISEIVFLSKNLQKDSQLLEIIKAQKIFLKEMKNENLVLKQFKQRSIGSASVFLNQFKQKVYRAIKIIEEPITTFSQSVSFDGSDEKSIIVGKVICWTGLWLGKIWTISNSILSLLTHTTNKESSKDIYNQVSKQIQTFLDYFSKGRMQQLTTNNSYEVGKDLNSSEQTQSQRGNTQNLRSDINYLFQLIYEIQLQRLND